jgi:hypothetical protein
VQGVASNANLSSNHLTSTDEQPKEPSFSKSFKRKTSSFLVSFIVLPVFKAIQIMFLEKKGKY